MFGVLGSDDNNADIETDFKCDKCDSNEGVISSQKETTTTILKDNAKPILKFSVSAILGDKKECARVRHGKCISNNLIHALCTQKNSSGQVGLETAV